MRDVTCEVVRGTAGTALSAKRTAGQEDRMSSGGRPKRWREEGWEHRASLSSPEYG